MESDQEDAWPAACTYCGHDLFITLLLKLTIYTYVIRTLIYINNLVRHFGRRFNNNYSVYFGYMDVLFQNKVICFMCGHAPFCLLHAFSICKHIIPLYLW